MIQRYKSICYKMNNDDINMKLDVNPEQLKKYQLDDYLPVTLALVSIMIKEKSQIEMKFHLSFFLDLIID